MWLIFNAKRISRSENTTRFEKSSNFSLARPDFCWKLRRARSGDKRSGKGSESGVENIFKPSKNVIDLFVMSMVVAIVETWSETDSSDEGIDRILLALRIFCVSILICLWLF